MHSKHHHKNSATSLWEQAGERTSHHPWRLQVDKIGWTCNASQSKVIYTSYEEKINLGNGDQTTVHVMEPQLLEPFLILYIIKTHQSIWSRFSTCICLALAKQNLYQASSPWNVAPLEILLYLNMAELNHAL